MKNAEYGIITSEKTKDAEISSDSSANSDSSGSNSPLITKNKNSNQDIDFVPKNISSVIKSSLNRGKVTVKESKRFKVKKNIHDIKIQGGWHEINNLLTNQITNIVGKNNNILFSWFELDNNDDSIFVSALKDSLDDNKEALRVVAQILIIDHYNFALRALIHKKTKTLSWEESFFYKLDYPISSISYNDGDKECNPINIILEHKINNNFLKSSDIKNLSNKEDFFITYIKQLIDLVNPINCNESKEIIKLIDTSINKDNNLIVNIEKKINNIQDINIKKFFGIVIAEARKSNSLEFKEFWECLKTENNLIDNSTIDSQITFEKNKSNLLLTSILYNLILSNNLSYIKLLVKEFPQLKFYIEKSINFLNEDKSPKFSPLWYAISIKNSEIIEYFLNNFHIDKSEYYSNSVLNAAISTKNISLMLKLLEQKNYPGFNNPKDIFLLKSDPIPLLVLLENFSLINDYQEQQVIKEFVNNVIQKLSDNINNELYPYIDQELRNTIKFLLEKYVKNPSYLHEHIISQILNLNINGKQFINNEFANILINNFLIKCNYEYASIFQKAGFNITSAKAQSCFKQVVTIKNLQKKPDHTLKTTELLIEKGINPELLDTENLSPSIILNDIITENNIGKEIRRNLCQLQNKMFLQYNSSQSNFTNEINENIIIKQNEHIIIKQNEQTIDKLNSKAKMSWQAAAQKIIRGQYFVNSAPKTQERFNNEIAKLEEKKRQDDKHNFLMTTKQQIMQKIEQEEAFAKQFELIVNQLTQIQSTQAVVVKNQGEMKLELKNISEKIDGIINCMIEKNKDFISSLEEIKKQQLEQKEQISSNNSEINNKLDKSLNALAKLQNAANIILENQQKLKTQIDKFDHNTKKLIENRMNRLSLEINQTMENNHNKLNDIIKSCSVNNNEVDEKKLIELKGKDLLKELIKISLFKGLQNNVDIASGDKTAYGDKADNAQSIISNVVAIIEVTLGSSPYTAPMALAMSLMVSIGSTIANKYKQQKSKRISYFFEITNLEKDFEKVANIFANKYEDVIVLLNRNGIAKISAVISTLYFAYIYENNLKKIIEETNANMDIDLSKIQGKIIQFISLNNSKTGTFFNCSVGNEDLSEYGREYFKDYKQPIIGFTISFEGILQRSLKITRNLEGQTEYYSYKNDSLFKYPPVCELYRDIKEVLPDNKLCKITEDKLSITEQNNLKDIIERKFSTQPEAKNTSKVKKRSSTNNKLRITGSINIDKLEDKSINELCDIIKNQNQKIQALEKSLPNKKYSRSSVTRHSNNQGKEKLIEHINILNCRINDLENCFNQIGGMINNITKDRNLTVSSISEPMLH